MNDSKKIKIVKKIDAVPRRKKIKIASTRATAREMVSTVSEWVTDLKARKRDETQAAIDLLFSSTPRTSES
jgi:hypothetical protein